VKERKKEKAVTDPHLMCLIFNGFIL